MIIILKSNTKKEQISQFASELEQNPGVKAHLIEGVHTTLICLVGDTTCIDADRLRTNKIVEQIKRIEAPYKNVNRKFNPSDTAVEVGGVKIGAGHFQVISGPCSVECEAQICEVAERVKAAGATMLRGGAFKPRTSPYAFQGLKAEGIELLLHAKAKTGLPIVSEITDISHLSLFEDVDVIQVGARNMQNFELLRELGHIRKPILLKRGLANTIEELLMSAEYILAGGNENVILCERGIRTFETATRNTFDVSAIPVLKRLSHLPVIADPSHAGGISWLVEPLAMAAVAAGADGIMIEVHNDPSRALSDGKQSLTPDEFDSVMDKIKNLLGAMGKSIG